MSILIFLAAIDLRFFLDLGKLTRLLYGEQHSTCTNVKIVNTCYHFNNFWVIFLKLENLGFEVNFGLGNSWVCLQAPGIFLGFDFCPYLVLPIT